MDGSYGHGEWVWDRIASASTTASIGGEAGSTASFFVRNTGALCAWEEAANLFFANITPLADGFIFDVAGAWTGANRDATLIAEYNYPR